MAYEVSLIGEKSDGKDRLIQIDARDIWRIKEYWDRNRARVYVRGYPSFDVKETSKQILERLEDMGIDISFIEKTEGKYDE
jgi:hypothetical protein